MKFYWVFNGSPINGGGGISTTKLGKRISALSIDNVSGEHAGNYTCVASNMAKSVNYTAELIVNGIAYFIYSMTTYILLDFFISLFFYSFHPYPYPFILKIFRNLMVFGILPFVSKPRVYNTNSNQTLWQIYTAKENSRSSIILN